MNTSKANGMIICFAECLWKFKKWDITEIFWNKWDTMPDVVESFNEIPSVCRILFG